MLDYWYEKLLGVDETDPLTYNKFRVLYGLKIVSADAVWQTLSRLVKSNTTLTLNTRSLQRLILKPEVAMLQFVLHFVLRLQRHDTPVTECYRQTGSLKMRYGHFLNVLT